MSAHLPTDAQVHQQLIGLALAYLTGTKPAPQPASPPPAEPGSQTHLTLLEALALLPTSQSR